jgi:hypothetical protein
MESVAEYRDRLKGTRVTLEVVDGLNHPQELEATDRVLPRELAFTKAHAAPR